MKTSTETTEDGEPRTGGEGTPFEIAVSDDPLEVTMAVVPPGNEYCLAVAASERGTVVTHHLRKVDPPTDETGICCDQCQVEVIYEEEDRSSFLQRSNDGGCIRQALAKTTCIPKAESFEDGAFVWTLIVPGRSELTELVDALRTIGASVELQRLVVSNRFSTPDESSLNQLTEKQRETVDVAVDRGYYESPREASLEEIADELGISTSAISERLNRAESKLIRSLLRF